MVEHVIMKWREQYQLVSMILSINPLHFTFASHAIIFADDANMQIIPSHKLCQISALQETEQLMPTSRQLDSWSEHWNPVSKLRKLWKRESSTSGWTIMTCKPGWILLRSVAKIQPKFNLWWKYVEVGTPKVLLKCIRWEGFVEDSLRESVFLLSVPLCFGNALFDFELYLIWVFHHHSPPRICQLVEIRGPSTVLGNPEVSVWGRWGKIDVTGFFFRRTRWDWKIWAIEVFGLKHQSSRSKSITDERGFFCNILTAGACVVYPGTTWFQVQSGKGWRCIVSNGCKNFEKLREMKWQL